MKILRILVPLLVTSCVATETTPGSRANAEGRGDLTGSCAPSSDDAELCGGQSDGSCWCDDSCAEYGDCCSDYAAECPPEEPAELLDVSELHPSLVPYGQSIYAIGIPACLSAAAFSEPSLHDFGAGNGLNGSGVHLGAGYIATARHVAAKWMTAEMQSHLEAFYGEEDFSGYLSGWTLRAMPEIHVIPRGGLLADDYGRWTDMVVLHAHSSLDADSLPPMSDATTLTVGQIVWIVGDKTGQQTRVAAGVISDITGHNVRVTNTSVEGGFSGSPVVDSAGHVVGIAAIRESTGDLVMVHGALLRDVLNRLAQDFDDVPL